MLVLSGPDVPAPEADMLVLELVSRGVPVIYFQAESWPAVGQLSLRLGAGSAPSGRLRLPTGELALDEVHSVWCGDLARQRALEFAPADPVARFVRHEAEAALRGLASLLAGRLWVNAPEAVRAADNKLDQLYAAQALGLTIPRTLVTNDPEEARAFFAACANEVIVKTFVGILAGDPDGPRPIYTWRVQVEHVDQIGLVQHSPCLFQEYVPKAAELRVTVIGRQVFTAEIDAQQVPAARDDWRRGGSALDEHWRAGRLPSQVEDGLRRMLDHYGLAYGAFDLIRRPDGQHVFLELNPQGACLGWEAATGLPLRAALGDLLVRGSLD